MRRRACSATAEQEEKVASVLEVTGHGLQGSNRGFKTIPGYPPNQHLRKNFRDRTYTDIPFFSRECHC